MCHKELCGKVCLLQQFVEEIEYFSLRHFIWFPSEKVYILLLFGVIDGLFRIAGMACLNSVCEIGIPSCLFYALIFLCMGTRHGLIICSHSFSFYLVTPCTLGDLFSPKLCRCSSRSTYMMLPPHSIGTQL